MEWIRRNRSTAILLLFLLLSILWTGWQWMGARKPAANPGASTIPFPGQGAQTAPSAPQAGGAAARGENPQRKPPPKIGRIERHLFAPPAHPRKKHGKTIRLWLDMIADRDGSRVARINGRLYRQGQRVGDYYRIEAIEPYRVRLRDPRGKLRVLRLY